MEKNRIGTAQLMILLFLSRLFNALTYIPGMGSTVSGTAMLFSNLIGAGVLLLLFLPLVVMANRYPERSIVMNLRAGFHGIGSFCSIFYYLFLILLAAQTLAQFQFFMSNAIYPDAAVWVIILPMLLVAVYAAHAGIEGIARAGFLIFIAFCIAFAFIILSSVQNVDLYNVVPLGHKAVQEIMQGVYAVVSRGAELVLFCLLLPYAGKGTGTAAAGFTLLSFSVQEIIGFFILTVLGSFSYSQTFPFFSLASMSEISVFQRMDALYMGIWVFVAFIRLSLLLLLAADIIKFILPDRKSGEHHRFSLAVTVLLVLAAALPACYNMKALSVSYQLLFSGVPVLVLGVLIPAGVLLKMEWKKNKNKERIK